jgi:multidrug resistance efflux pump
MGALRFQTFPARNRYRTGKAAGKRTRLPNVFKCNSVYMLSLIAGRGVAPRPGPLVGPSVKRSQIEMNSYRSKTLVPAAGMLTALLLAGCSPAPPPAHTPSVSKSEAPVRADRRTHVRTTGIVRALEWQMIRVPRIAGQWMRVTLTRIIPNGASVRKGDLLAEFDRTSLLDDERDAKAKLSDLSHQLDDKRASVKSDQTKRLAAIKAAEADLNKAQLELKKGPILSGIDKAKNEAKAEYARLEVASLRKSDGYRKIAEDAAVKTLELKLERQRVVLERVESNLDKLVVRAPQDGMVALENTWRNGSMGPSQEGDQLSPGMPLLRIFNPLRMVVEATVNEPDIAWLQKTTTARVWLDAYPGAVFDAALESANPVATSGLDSPVRTFNAIFRIDEQDPRLLPDLSASLEIGPPERPSNTAAVTGGAGGGQ